jgi:hypothetical protein
MRIFYLSILSVFVSIYIGDFNTMGAQEKAHVTSAKLQNSSFIFDFTDYQEGTIESWLKEKGFKFKLGANNRRARVFRVDENGCTVEVKKPIRGYVLNDSVGLERFSKVRIEWGVIEYPEGVPYEQNINNEPAMLVIFYGYGKIYSGHFAIPNAPYFIGFFLGENDVVNKVYKGNYFQKGGRYICVGNPEPNKMIVTEIDLITAFQGSFDKDDVPVISGIAIGGDTSKAKNLGRASAIFKRIEFLE